MLYPELYRNRAFRFDRSAFRPYWDGCIAGVLKPAIGLG